MENILKTKLIENYLRIFREKINKKNISDCTTFLLDCLDDSIQQAQTLPLQGADKKVLVLSIILEIYNVVISKNLPIYLKPFDLIIKTILIQIVISKLIDFIVDKYNRGAWRKESNYVSEKNL